MIVGPTKSYRFNRSARSARPVGPVRADANSSFGNICPNFFEIKLLLSGNGNKKILTTLKLIISCV